CDFLPNHRDHLHAYLLRLRGPLRPFLRLSFGGPGLTSPLAICLTSLMVNISSYTTPAPRMRRNSRCKCFDAEYFAIQRTTLRTGIRLGNPYILINLRILHGFPGCDTLSASGFCNGYPVRCPFLHAVFFPDKPLD